MLSCAGSTALTMSRSRVSGALGAHPLDVVPPNLVPAGNAASAAFDARAVDDRIGADALDQEQAGREVSGGLAPLHDLAVAQQVINDGAMTEHQLPGDQRPEQPVARGRYRSGPACSAQRARAQARP